MAFGDEDRDAFLADFGVPVAIGSATTTGIFDEERGIFTDDNGQQVEADETSVLVRKGSLAGIVIDASITIDGTAYVIHRSEPEPPDGRFTRVYVAEA